MKFESELCDKCFGDIIGFCVLMCEVFCKFEKVVSMDISVLIIGEIGIGKELVVCELHCCS